MAELPGHAGDPQSGLRRRCCHVLLLLRVRPRHLKHHREEGSGERFCIIIVKSDMNLSDNSSLLTTLMVQEKERLIKIYSESNNYIYSFLFIIYL